MHIRKAKYDWELHGIIDLQSQNLENNISPEQIESEGFVTVRHEYELLAQMNKAAPSIVAVDNDKVVGYTLSMPKQFKEDIPFLIPMFDHIDSLYLDNTSFKDIDYIIGGQICIAPAYRGVGLFNLLYNKARDCYQEQYPIMLTEVSDRNMRSIRAHEKCGFKTIHKYALNSYENWYIMLWDWSNI